MIRIFKSLLAGAIFYAIVTTIAMVVVFIKCLALRVPFTFFVALFAASRVAIGSAAIIAIFTFITLGNRESRRTGRVDP